MAIYEVANTTYYVDKGLMKHWGKNTLKKMKKKNQDRVFIVDGRERIGKSTWVFQQMGIIEPEIFKSPEKFCSRVCIDVDEFNRVVRTTKNGVICFDEAFRGFSSRSALSKTNKMLIQTLMEMGQNNNIVFIVLPSFFLLDIYPAMIRSNSLFHVKTDQKTNLRIWEGFNAGDKNEMYQGGVKKRWNYKRTPFKGRFPKQFPGGDAFERAYIQKKGKAFAQISLSMYAEDTESKIKRERDLIAWTIYNNPEMYGSKKRGLRKCAIYLKTQGINLTYASLSLLFKKFQPKEDGKDGEIVKC